MSKVASSSASIDALRESVNSETSGVISAAEWPPAIGELIYMDLKGVLVGLTNVIGVVDFVRYKLFVSEVRLRLFINFNVDIDVN